MANFPGSTFPSSVEAQPGDGSPDLAQPGSSTFGNPASGSAAASALSPSGSSGTNTDNNADMKDALKADLNADTHADQAVSSQAGQGVDGDLFNRVVQGAHDTIDRLAQTAAPHVQRLQEGVNSAGDVLNSRAGQLRETGDEWTETLRVTVRENPVAAVVTALAVGMLIARLTRR